LSSHPKYKDEESLDFDLGVDEYIEKYISRNSGPYSLHTPVWDLLDRGGKRFRPLLAHLCCKTVRGKSDPMITSLAAAVELLHNMTLIHDDIEDNSDVRRGKPCIHKIYGVPLAINTADFMAVKVFDMILSNGVDHATKVKILQKIVERILQMLHGQAIEIESRQLKSYDVNLAVEIMKNKTAALVMLSSEIGSIIGGGDETQIQLIQRYAGYAGLAFQITDDILNLVATKKYGKEIGGDLREGKRTVIVSHYISNSSESDKNRILKNLGKKDTSEKEIKKMISLMEQKGSISYARQLADFYLNCGLYYLWFLPDNDGRKSLVKLSRFLTRRTW